MALCFIRLTVTKENSSHKSISGFVLMTVSSYYKMVVAAKNTS